MGIYLGSTFSSTPVFSLGNYPSSTPFNLAVPHIIMGNNPGSTSSTWQYPLIFWGTMLAVSFQISSTPFIYVGNQTSSTLVTLAVPFLNCMTSQEQSVQKMILFFKCIKKKRLQSIYKDGELS